MLEVNVRGGASPEWMEESSSERKIITQFNVSLSHYYQLVIVYFTFPVNCILYFIIVFEPRGLNKVYIMFFSHITIQ